MNHVVRLLCVALLICILLFCIQSVEGFKESIPEYCGSAGYTPSKALSIAFKTKPEDLHRGYTKSECDKIDSSTYANGGCTIKKDGKEIYCHETCKGLNKIPTTPPGECNIDGKLAGITNKEIKIKGDTFPENTLRFYTQKECESLNGKHNISFLTDMNETNRNDFIEKYGKGYGLCMGSTLDTWYSFICYAEPPSVVDIKNKISGLF